MPDLSPVIAPPRFFPALLFCGANHILTGTGICAFPEIIIDLSNRL